jgi:hypothetical protein
MPLPGVFDLVLYRGDTYAWQFRIWSDAAQTVPVDLTGAVAKSEIRDKPAGTVILDLEAVITLPNSIELSLDAADWTTLPAAGVWDLQLTFPDGTVRTPVGGKVTTYPDVTDSVAAPARSPVSVRRAG